MKLNCLWWILLWIPVACGGEGDQADRGSDSDSDLDSDTGDGGAGNSTDSGENENTDSASETPSWDDAGTVCFAPDCVEDSCRGFGEAQCPDCPTLSEIVGGELPSDLDTYTETYVCYYAPACGGATCSLYVNDAGNRAWQCGVRPC